MSLWVWYPIVSEGIPVLADGAGLVHAGSSGPAHPCPPDSAWLMKPFISPPLISAGGLLSGGGPPPLTPPWAPYRAPHGPDPGSVTHPFGVPVCVGVAARAAY